MARATYRRRGLDIPPQLFPPRMLPGADEWLDAFFELHTERSYGMSPGPIPGSAIAAWPVAEEERPLFRRCIRAMDNAWLNYGKDAPQAKTATEVLKGRA